MNFPEMKDIPGYEGLYAVTKDGRVWSYPRRKTQGGWLAGGKTKDGYRYVCLRKDGCQHYPRVASIVLETFTNSPPEGCEVDHKNNIRDDDRLTNLQWISHQENVQRIWAQGRRTMQGSQNTRAFLNEEQVLEIRRVRAMSTLSYQKIADRFGLRKGHIADICTGRIWNHLNNEQDT